MVPPDYLPVRPLPCGLWATDLGAVNTLHTVSHGLDLVLVRGDLPCRHHQVRRGKLDDLRHLRAVIVSGGRLNADCDPQRIGKLLRRYLPPGSLVALESPEVPQMFVDELLLGLRGDAEDGAPLRFSLSFSPHFMPPGDTGAVPRVVCAQTLKAAAHAGRLYALAFPHTVELSGLRQYACGPMLKEVQQALADGARKRGAG